MSLQTKIMRKCQKWQNESNEWEDILLTAGGCITSWNLYIVTLRLHRNKKAQANTWQYVNEEWANDSTRTRITIHVTSPGNLQVQLNAHTYYTILFVTWRVHTGWRCCLHGQKRYFKARNQLQNHSWGPIYDAEQCEGILGQHMQLRVFNPHTLWRASLKIIWLKTDSHHGFASSAHSPG
jgi:hypothetical protein